MEVLDTAYETIATDEDEVRWSKHLESVRKDVECAFGSLKVRFKILKLPLMYRDVEHVDNVFYSCAILHNMLLRWDGRELMEEDEHEVSYGDLSEAVVEDGSRKAGKSKGYRKQTLHAKYDATRVGQDEMHCDFARVTEAIPPNHAPEVEEDCHFHSFRRSLVDHYAIFVRTRQR
jgi:hypothetical protein